MTQRARSPSLSIRALGAFPIIDADEEQDAVGSDADKDAGFDLRPSEAIANAMETLVITVKVSDAIESGRWNAMDLKPHVIFRGTGEPLWMPIHQGELTDKDLHSWTNNVTYYCLGVLLITLEDALNGTFGTDPLGDSDVERRSIRCVVHILRSHFAHHAVRPRWHIKDRYARRWEIPSIGLSLDGPALDGQPVRSSDYGGWTKVLLLADKVRSVLK